MTSPFPNPFKRNRLENGPGTDLLYDPTLPEFLETTSGIEMPESDGFVFVSGTRHPQLEDLSELLDEPENGSMRLPSTIPLVRREGCLLHSRRPHYGVDLVLQNTQRSAHTMVLGPTGCGKNVYVIDPLRFSAIADPSQTVITFSLKSSDYGAIRMACEKADKRMVVINLNDAWRSAGWNPLATKKLDVAFDRLRRFVDATMNQTRHDSPFWGQLCVTASAGAWQAGYQSFPDLYDLFSLPIHQLIDTMRGFDNPSSDQVVAFYAGGSHNSETSMATIVGAMNCFISEQVRRVTSSNELDLEKCFDEPVVLHVEMPEVSLDSHRELYRLLARIVIDTLIDIAEVKFKNTAPVTIFFDDFPSLGPLLPPERLMTMRSRSIGIVAGVQSLASLQLQYGEAWRAVLDNLGTKIILPGGPVLDANHFSSESGEQLVTLPTCVGNNATLIHRPLLSASDIRVPSCTHPILGKPATMMFGATTFQVYLQKSYEIPTIAKIHRQARTITGRERLRKQPVSKPIALADRIDPPEEVQAVTDANDWSFDQIMEQYDLVCQELTWPACGTLAAKWWQGVRESPAIEPKHKLRLVEELLIRKTTPAQFFEVFDQADTNNVNYVLSYMGCLQNLSVLKQRAEKIKRMS